MIFMRVVTLRLPPCSVLRVPMSYKIQITFALLVGEKLMAVNCKLLLKKYPMKKNKKLWKVTS